MPTHAVLAVLATVWLAPFPSASAAENGGRVTGVIALPAPDRRGEPPVRNRGFVPRARNPLKPPKAFNPLPFVIVVLEGGPVAGEDAKPPAKPVRYDVVGESFETPLLPVVAGTRIEIKNESRNSPRLYSPQVAELLAGDPINPDGVRTAAPLSETEKLIEIRDHDSAHLRGHLVAFPHSYFSLVDDSGRFSIEGVPEGTWTVKIWHLGGWVKLRKPVTVDVPANRAAKPVSIDLPANLDTSVPSDA